MFFMRGVYEVRHPHRQTYQALPGSCNPRLVAPVNLSYEPGMKNAIAIAQIALSCLLVVTFLRPRTIEPQAPIIQIMADDRHLGDSFMPVSCPVVRAAKQPAPTPTIPHFVGIEETESGSLIFGIGINSNLIESLAAPPLPKPDCFWRGSFFH
jgi:hypothetical protein